MWICVIFLRIVKMSISESWCPPYKLVGSKCFLFLVVFAVLSHRLLYNLTFHPRIFMQID